MNNRLLELLLPWDRERIVRDSVVTSLRHMKRLYSTDEPLDAVYFPLDCVVSIVVGAGDGTKVEMATIGNEGVVGAFSALSSGRAIGDHVVQVAGEARRLDLLKFNAYLQERGSFHQLTHRYLFAFMRQIIQSGACHRLHTMEERCARWLLMMQDRTQADTFPLTQEFLSEMLGVRRATVNLALGILKTAGLIRYVRGQITVLDRVGLESASCPCYELIRQEYQKLKLD